ncbi:glycosyltransferase family 2 protein [Actibacterium ureilyticum]|uniref:glycosyltransferase family 2 protein n=1 Tax=Actibacterium ureilyticum TaxID=1590614 RepID=UPI000BAB233B|nr:glycosyltransferase family 2 protein [Actibacterium ureilyticum]
MRALAVLTVKNEGAFLLDWLAHHQAVGFTDFLVLSNDCDDGTDTLLDRLQTLGHLTHLPNPAPHQGGVQFAALKRADAHPLVKQADWIMTLDIDEFVNIHVGDHTLPDLIGALPRADAIPLTWRWFGNAGVVAYQDLPIPDQFTRAAPAVLHWPWRAAMFKTLYRNNGIYRKLGVHRPRSPDPDRVDGAVWIDGAGRNLPSVFRRQQLFSPFGRDNYRLAQLNHYPLGAMESYVVKCDRGRAVHEADSLGMDYWVERNLNTDTDRSIDSLRVQRQSRRQALSDDEIVNTLHKAAVQWRHDRFRTLMKSEPNRALFGRLLMTPPTKPLDAATAARILRLR